MKKYGRMVFEFFTHSTSVGKLIGKSILMLLIPYAYLFVCGFVFDYLLKWYGATLYIAISLGIFWLIAVILIIYSIIWYIKKGRK